MKRIKAAVFLFCILLSIPAIAGGEIHQSMTVDEAYAAIPHQRTVFDTSAAKMDVQEKKFLAIFFSLIDKAVAEKVIRLKSIGGHSVATDNYDAILAKLGELQVPDKLEKVYRLVMEAVQEQRQYLAQLVKGGESFSSGAPLVQSSHGNLVAAYGELMRLFPAEGQSNKQSFFDYLCALDFI